MNGVLLVWSNRRVGNVAVSHNPWVLGDLGVPSRVGSPVRLWGGGGMIDGIREKFQANMGLQEHLGNMLGTSLQKQNLDHDKNFM
jgi:hypothetical protein